MSRLASRRAALHWIDVFLHRQQGVSPALLGVSDGLLACLLPALAHGDDELSTTSRRAFERLRVQIERECEWLWL